MKLSANIGCFLVALTFAPLFSQVEIQWITPSSATPKLTRGQALAISKTTNITVLVSGVNDIYYDHKIKLTLVPKVFNDAANLDLFPTPTGDALAATDCGELPTLIGKMETAIKAYEDEKKSSTLASTKYIPLDTALTTINKVETSVKAVSADPHYSSCRTPPQRAKDRELAEKVAALKALPHAASASIFVDPAFDLAIEVSAWTQTDAKSIQIGDTFKVTVGVFTNQLSLSLGVLTTKLEARTYASRNSVGTDGALAANRLAVENSGMRATGTALLNYALIGGGGSAGQDRFGLSISAGPTVAVGGSAASSFGFFSGISFRLWDRLFLTPGAHIGQFSEFPPGLQAGVAIPANYGALTAVNRWTTRFGFAITFRTNDFSAIKKSTPTKATSTSTPAAK